jgi:hypothetical protein
MVAVDHLQGHPLRTQRCRRHRRRRHRRRRHRHRRHRRRQRRRRLLLQRDLQRDLPCLIAAPSQTRRPLAGTRQSVARSIRVVRDPGWSQGAQAVRAHRATRPGALSLWVWRRHQDAQNPPASPPATFWLQGVLHLQIYALCITGVTRRRAKPV